MIPMVPPALIDQVKKSQAVPALLQAAPVQSQGPNIAERVLIFRVCALLGIPLKQIGTIPDREHAPVLLIDAEMSQELANKLSLGFKGVYHELGIIDSKGQKFLFSDRVQE